MNSWLFSLTTLWAIVAIFLYILECILIVKKWKILRSSFFKIYFASAVVNALTYLNSLITLRIPNQTSRNGLFASIFDAKHFFGLELFYTLMNHFAFVQYLITTLFAINRLTALIMPLRYERVWRHLFLPSLAFVIISPIVFTYPCLLAPSSYRYQTETDNYGTVTRADFLALNAQLSYVMTVLTLITTVMNIATFMIFLKHRSSTKFTEFKLLVHNVIIFATQLFAVIILTIISYEPPNTTLFKAMLALFPYVSDMLTLLPPFVILLCSSVLQNGLKSMLCNTNIVHIVPSNTNVHTVS